MYSNVYMCACSYNIALTITQQKVCKIWMPCSLLLILLSATALNDSRKLRKLGKTQEKDTISSCLTKEIIHLCIYIVTTQLQ